MVWWFKSTRKGDHPHSSYEREKGNDDSQYVKIVRALHGIAYEQSATRHQEHTYERKKGRREWLTIIGLFLAAGFALGQGIIFYCTMQVTEQAADTQHIDTQAALTLATAANRA